MMSRRSLSLLLGMALVAALAVACSVPGRTPRIIEHPRPTLSVDASVFDAREALAEELGCDRIHGPSDLYGGLEPGYPVAVCAKDWKPEDECLYIGGGIYRECYQALVHIDGEFRLIGNQEELGALFAPIESADEALSLALLATKLSAKYDPADYRLALPDSCDPGPNKYHYYTDDLEDTHVDEVGSGYQVHLFGSAEFGCAPHPVWSVAVQVDRDGTIVQAAEEKLFEENLDAFGISTCCVD